MLTTDQQRDIALELMTGAPRRVRGEEADAFRLELAADIIDSEEEGYELRLPFDLHEVERTGKIQGESEVGLGEPKALGTSPPPRAIEKCDEPGLMTKAAAPGSGAGGGNCGTGTGGFKGGNTCAAGGWGGASAIAKGWKSSSVMSGEGTGPNKNAPGFMNYDPAGWHSTIPHNGVAKLNANKIAAMEAAALAGNWDKVVGMHTYDKNAKSKPNLYARAAEACKQKLLANKTAYSSNAAAAATPVSEPISAKKAAVDAAAGKMADEVNVKELSGWNKVGGKLGTVEGGTFVNASGKNKIYAKFPSDPAVRDKELAAFELYKAAGANVLDAEGVTLNGKQGLATKWEDNSAHVNWSINKAGGQVATKALKQEAQEDFAVHAWLNNRDAVGAGSENPEDNLKLINGKITMVDPGGSFNVKGGGKKKEFAGDAPEWESMRDKSTNPTMGNLFGGMTSKQLYDSAQKLKSVSDKQIDDAIGKMKNVPDVEKSKLKTTLKARRDAIVKKAEAGYVTDKNGQGVSNGKKAASVHETLAAGAKTKQEKAVVKANKLNDAKPALELTQPPLIEGSGKGNASVNKKYMALYDSAQKAAKTGDHSLLENGSSTMGPYKVASKEYIDSGKGNNYTKGAFKYKQQLLKDLANGAKPTDIEAELKHISEGTKAKAKAPAPVFKPEQVPNPTSSPSFQSNSTSYKAQHDEAVAKLYKAAKESKGDSKGVESIAVHPGSKAENYKKALLADIKEQMTPPPPPPEPPPQYKGTLAALEKTAKPINPVKSPTKFKAADRVGRMLILEKPGVFDGHEKIKEKVSPESIHHKGEDAIDKYRNASPENAKKWDALYKYTGGSFGSMNGALSGGQHSKGNGKQAKMAGQAILEGAGLDLGGTTIYRGASFGTEFGNVNTQINAMKNSAGMVLQETAVVSTARTKAKAWAGHMLIVAKAMPGALGAAVGASSSTSKNHHEDEIVIPPGARLHVQNVRPLTATEKKMGKGWQFAVEAIYLPSHKDQLED